MSSDAAIVLQARMGSTRLPGKVFAPIEGRTVLRHCLKRLLASGVGPVVLATTVGDEDDVLVAEGEATGVTVLRGHRLDVLSRFAAVARKLGPAIVIRATADNPAVDIDAPRRLIEALDASGADYCSESGLPIGAGVEAVRTAALLDAHHRAVAAADREHVTTFVRSDRARYRVIERVAPEPIRRPDLRLTIDTPGDLSFMRAMACRLGVSLSSARLTEIIDAADGASVRESIA